jgi:hypothetical protein
MVFASLLTFFWGVHDSGVTNFFLCICGFQFESKTVPFSVLRTVQAFSNMAFIYVEAPLKD